MRRANHECTNNMLAGYYLHRLLGAWGSLQEVSLDEIVSTARHDLPIKRRAISGLLRPNHVRLVKLLQVVLCNVLSDSDALGDVIGNHAVNLGKHDQNTVLYLVAVGAALLLCRCGEFPYLLAQVLVLRFKAFVLGLKIRRLSARNRKLLLENRDLLLKQREMLALNRGRSVLLYKSFNRTEKVSEFHGERGNAPNEKKISYGSELAGGVRKHDS